ncbi:hypothetical protein ACJQWK_10407 [Exserohilum turcicum]
MSSPKDTAISKYLQGFDNLDEATAGIITSEISSLKTGIASLTETFDQLVTKTGHLKIQQLGIQVLQANLQQEDAELKNAKSSSKAQALQRKLKMCEKERMQHQKDVEEQHAALVTFRDGFAELSLGSLQALWRNKPSDSEQLQIFQTKLGEAMGRLEESKATEAVLSTELAAERYKFKKLASRLAALEGSIDEKEKALKDKHRELEKGYYGNVQKLVEGRVSDEKAKLADQLSQAEDKILRFDKLCAANKELEAKVIELTRELTLLQQAKLELEQRYKKREEEGKVFRQGYDQLSNDIRTLCTEKVELQTEYDEVKKQHNQLLEQQRQSNSGVSTALDPVWQNALSTTKTNLQQSQAKKKDLQTKIQDAETLLKELKSARSSKQRRATNSKATTPRNGQEQPAIQQTTEQVPPSVPRNRVLRANESTDAFPPLNLPLAPRPVPSNTYKSLRLVYALKKETPGDGDKSSELQE